MSWEQVLKGGHAAHSPQWGTDPRVGLTKSGIIFNKHLLDALKLSPGDSILVLIDKANFKVGLKIAETDEDRLGAYCLRHPNGKGQERGTALVLSCVRVPKTFPLATGNDYPVKMPEGSMIMEVQLPNPRANKGD